LNESSIGGGGQGDYSSAQASPPQSRITLVFVIWGLQSELWEDPAGEDEADWRRSAESVSLGRSKAVHW